MAATAVDANTFYNKLKAEPDDKLKLGDKQVVLQTTTGPNQVLKLDTKPEVAPFSLLGSLSAWQCRAWTQSLQWLC